MSAQGCLPRGVCLEGLSAQGGLSKGVGVSA